MSLPRAFARSCWASGFRAAAIQNAVSTKTSGPAIDLLVEASRGVAGGSLRNKSEDRREIGRRCKGCSSPQIPDELERPMYSSVGVLRLARFQHRHDVVGSHILILQEHEGGDQLQLERGTLVELLSHICHASRNCLKHGIQRELAFDIGTASLTERVVVSPVSFLVLILR